VPARIEIPVASPDHFMVYLLQNKVGFQACFIERQEARHGAGLAKQTVPSVTRKINYFDRGDGVYAMLYFDKDPANPFRSQAQIIKVTPSRSEYWFADLEAVVKRYDNASAGPLNYAGQALLLLHEAMSNRNAEKREHFRQSIKLAEKAYELDPTLTQALNCKGAAQSALGNNAGAIESYLAAIKADSRCVRPWLNLGNRHKQAGVRDRMLYSYRIGVDRPPFWVGDDFLQAATRRELSTGTAQTAETAFLLADRNREIDRLFSHHQLDSRPSEHPALEAGVRYGRQGRWSKALSAFVLAATDDPEDLKARNNRAHALIQLGRYGEALACCDDVLADNPDFFTCVQTRAEALIMLDRETEGLKCLERIARTHTGNPAVIYYRALVEEHLELWSQAAASYRKLAVGRLEGCADQSAYARRRLQEFLHYRDREIVGPMLAERLLADRFHHITELLDCRQSKAIATRLPDISGGSLTLHRSFMESALALCNTFLADAPDDPDVLCYRAMCWLQDAAGEYLAAADSDCNRVLRTNPAHPEALVIKAECLLREARQRGSGLDPEPLRWAEGMACYERAAAIDARHPAVWYAKALAEDAGGDMETASRTFRQFVVVSPDRHGSHLQYARTRLHHMEFWAWKRQVWGSKEDDQHERQP